MGLTPQDIYNAKTNIHIQNAARNYVRPQDYKPMKANMDADMQRQATW